MALSNTSVQKTIGVLGLIFPISLILVAIVRDFEFPHSLSSYYYTPGRPVFVFVLITIGVLLIAYRGPSRDPQKRIFRNLDYLISTICGITAISLALIPTKVCLTPTDCFESTTLFSSRIIHYGSATVLFVGEAYISRFLFSQNVSSTLSWIFKRIGDCLFLLIVLLIVLVVTKASKGTPLIFWLQAAMVWLFSFAWLLKGLTSNQYHEGTSIKHR